MSCLFSSEYNFLIKLHFLFTVSLKRKCDQICILRIRKSSKEGVVKWIQVPRIVCFPWVPLLLLVEQLQQQVSATDAAEAAATEVKVTATDAAAEVKTTATEAAAAVKTEATNVKVTTKAKAKKVAKKAKEATADAAKTSI